MLACATQSEPALLIIEYCVHGDLLNYMRERWVFFINSLSLSLFSLSLRTKLCDRLGFKGDRK